MNAVCASVSFWLSNWTVCLFYFTQSSLDTIQSSEEIREVHLQPSLWFIDLPVIILNCAYWAFSLWFFMIPSECKRYGEEKAWRVFKTNWSMPFFLTFYFSWNMWHFLCLNFFFSLSFLFTSCLGNVILLPVSIFIINYSISAFEVQIPINHLLFALVWRYFLSGWRDDIQSSIWDHTVIDIYFLLGVCIHSVQLLNFVLPKNS